MRSEGAAGSIPAARPTRHAGRTIRSPHRAGRTRPRAVRPSTAAAVTFRSPGRSRIRLLAAEADLLSPWPYILGALLAHGGIGADPDCAPHVRAASVDARILVEDTAARSPLVRDLVARLGTSDVIVYVEMTASPQVPRARTKLVAASPGVRFLRIGISSSIPFEDRGALLGHELQHAVEIAARDDVRDENALRRLYLRIGRKGSDDSFETDAALDVECRVRLECRQHDDCLDAGNLDRR